MEHVLLINPRTDLSVAESLIESCCAEAGLRVTLKDTLAAYPGCMHWYLKRGNDKGTLEITLWREQRRIWFKVASNRGGPWIIEAIEQLRSCIEGALR